MASAATLRHGWHPLGMPPKELRLENTLPTGQSFRWRMTSQEPLEYAGLVGRRVVVLQQSSADVEFRVIGRAPGETKAGDRPALEEYFQKHVSLGDLSIHWAERDERFCQLSPYVPGARMLRQDPLECLFSFICSSNNHISRIHGMVERLAANYGDVIEVSPEYDALAGMKFYAFPTLKQLSVASEEALRADGYGYRAKFIVGAVEVLQSHPEGGHSWLMGLRDKPLQEAVAELQTLPGIGPKVAACVALFSLDKSAAIPVDTHVWQLALRYYCPHLKDRSLTPKVHGEVQAAFQDVFGEHCGWAHNTLFISELPRIRDSLPPHLQPPPVEKPTKKKGGKDKEEGGKSLLGSGGKKKARRSNKEQTPAPPKKAVSLKETKVKATVTVDNAKAKAQGKARRGRKASALGTGGASSEGEEGDTSRQTKSAKRQRGKASAATTLAEPSKWKRRKPAR